MTVETGRLPAEGVRAMFDRIAPVYDVMNRLMTAGLDRRWRRETARSVVRPGNAVLDACCGNRVPTATTPSRVDVSALTYPQRTPPIDG